MTSNIISFNHLMRELSRDEKSVEVPLYSSEYHKWLENRSELNDDTRRNYKIWLHRADELICVVGKDFYELFPEALRDGDFACCSDLIDWYDAQLTAVLSDKSAISPKVVSDYRSAWRKYAAFLREKISQAVADATLRQARESASSLFMEVSFWLWMVTEDSKSPNTADSYISYIKTANRKLLCKQGADRLSSLPRLLKAHDTSAIERLFAEIDAALTERLDTADTTDLSLKQLNDSRSALRKYATYIMSVTVAD